MEKPMETVTISPKFQVVIPRVVRESLGIKPGQKVQVIAYDDRIELVPVKPARKMRGFLKGIDTDVPREADQPKTADGR
jgi:AbrB family looped-hinge helix DNA binding protein